MSQSFATIYFREKGVGVEMLVNKDNINSMDKLKIHDSEITNVSLQYDVNIAKMYINSYHLKKDMVIVFKEVLYLEMTDIKLWGKGEYILDWELNEDDKMLHNFMEIQKKELQEEYVVWSKLTESNNMDDFFSISFVLNSGDKVTVICKEIRWE